MKYEDSRLLLRYAKLQLEIANAKTRAASKAEIAEAASRAEPNAPAATDKTVQRSVGFKKLRAWFLRMSPLKRGQAKTWLRKQCDGIEQIKRLAIEAGADPLDALAGIQIVHKDADGNEVQPRKLPDARNAGPEPDDVSEPTPEELERARLDADKLRANVIDKLREGRDAIAKTGKE